MGATNRCGAMSRRNVVGGVDGVSGVRLGLRSGGCALGGRRLVFAIVLVFAIGTVPRSWEQLRDRGNSSAIVETVPGSFLVMETCAPRVAPGQKIHSST